MHEGTVAPDTWAVIAGRGAHTPGSPLNVPPVLASNFVLGGDRAYTRNDGTATWEAYRADRRSERKRRVLAAAAAATPSSLSA